MPRSARISNIFNYTTAIGVEQINQRSFVDRSGWKERLLGLICQDGLLVVSGYSSIGKTSLLNLATARAELGRVGAPYRAVVPILVDSRGEGGILRGFYDQIAKYVAGKRPDALTPAYLAEAIHRSQLLLIIDGVNSLYDDPGATGDLFSLGKIWTDLQRGTSVQSKIVFVASGVPQAAHTWLNQAGLGKRLPREHIDIPPWDDGDLLDIMHIGGRRLEVNYAADLCQWLVRVACGLPATMTLLAALSTRHANSDRDEVVTGTSITVELSDLRGILGESGRFKSTLYYSDRIDDLGIPALFALYVLGLNKGLMLENQVFEHTERCGFPSDGVSGELENLIVKYQLNEEMYWNIRELSYGTFAFLRLYHRSRQGTEDAVQIAQALDHLVETEISRERRTQIIEPKFFHSGGTLMISILFLAADPTDASRLRLGKEFREIDTQLRQANLRNHFKLELPQLSLRARDISGALLNTQPSIVHFSGHGTSEGALCFENESGQTLLVQPDALAALFEQFKDQVDCVVLNACYSESQARVIAKHIRYVVAMNSAIGDEAAIAFTVGFYQALGAGRTIEEAHKLGCVQIRLQGIPEHLTPILVRKDA